MTAKRTRLNYLLDLITGNVSTEELEARRLERLHNRAARRAYKSRQGNRGTGRTIKRLGRVAL